MATQDPKKFNSKEIKKNQQADKITCAAGIGVAIIIATCIFLDQRKNEETNINAA